MLCVIYYDFLKSKKKKKVLALRGQGHVLFTLKFLASSRMPDT